MNTAITTTLALISKTMIIYFNINNGDFVLPAPIFCFAILIASLQDINNLTK